MKKSLLMLLAVALVGAGVTPTDVEAATKKKVVAAKKKAPRIAKQARNARKLAQRGASLDDAQHLALQSSAVLVLDQTTGAILFEKNPNAVLPIASITKLMTAMVVLDAKPDLKEALVIGRTMSIWSRAPGHGSRSGRTWSGRKCSAWP
jgi:D-alanyl-D-alanine endopeptidase (penicillin-binding protein 7)